MGLAPGWAVVSAAAFMQLGKRYRPVWGFAAGWGGLQAARFFLQVLPLLGQSDPNKLAARWLIDNCPVDYCVAYAENFANYWPIRYYSSFDRIELNVLRDNWKTQPQFSADVKDVAGCWSPHSERMYKGTFKNIREFPASDSESGVLCFKGITL